MKKKLANTLNTFNKQWERNYFPSILCNFGTMAGNETSAVYSIGRADRLTTL
jgi:hypothetical protein